MAEIRIEKKKGIPIWALLLALILLVLLVWSVLALRRDNREAVPNNVVGAFAWDVSAAFLETEPVVARCA
jgi:hypothetical protein